MSTIGLEIARGNLQAAERAVEQERMESARREVPALRTQAREMLKRSKRLHGKFTQLNAEVLAMRGELLPTWQEYQRFSAPPEWDEEMPEHERAETAEQWRKRHASLLADIAEKEKKVESLRRELQEICATLPRIEMSIKNLTAVAQGRLPGQV